MATAEFKATAGSVTASAASANLIGATIAAVTSADTAVGTVVTANTASVAAIDAFAAAVIAITGDTYTAHQFGGAATVGLTSAQCNTLFKTGANPLNTAITDVLTAQTDTNTAKTDTAAAVTAAAAIAADISLYIGNVSNVADMNILRNMFRSLERVLAGSGLLGVGSGSPRSP